MPVGETRPAAHFLRVRRPNSSSERRLQAEKIEFFRTSDRDFPTHSGPRAAGTGHDHTQTHTAQSRHTHTQHYTANGVTPPAASMAVAAVPAMRTAACENRTGTPIAAPRRSRRWPPSGHDTGRERGGCGRAPESVAAAAAASDAPLGRLWFVHQKRPRQGCLNNRAP